MSRRVFIVREGSWGRVEAESYQKQVEFYRRALEGTKDSMGGKAARVTVIDTIAEAERRLEMEADVVVFISRGVEQAAERIARENPRVRVVVFTASIPEGKVVWADKAFTADPQMVEQIVLYS